LVPADGKYLCWWGYDRLPELRIEHPLIARMLYRDPDSVLQRWLARGLDHWRFKVPDSKGFEAVYGPEGVVYLQWIDTLYRCCNAIARVGNAATGEPAGTGFLVSGTDLRSRWGDGPRASKSAGVPVAPT
jgi:hypothetical protein